MNENLKPKLNSYLKERLPNFHEILEVEHLSGGACQDNYLLKLQLSHNVIEVVFRTDKGSALFSSLEKEEEFEVAKIAYEKGVLTPKPILLEKDSSYFGSPFYIMEKISGKALGRFVVKDPSLKELRKELPKLLARELSKIHTIKPQDFSNQKLREKLLKGVRLAKELPKNSLDVLRKQVETLEEAHPAMELVLNWLEENTPEVEELVLVHGDFRTGNFMVEPSGLKGILDWEFARFGDRHEDIAWLCMRDWRFGKVNLEVGGFGVREDFYKYYEEFSGKKVSPKSVLFWEVVGNLRWALGTIEQAERHISGKDKGIELASIGRRVTEMEYEAMRLIENAR